MSKELESLEGLTFSTKRGTTNVVLSAELSEDKKSVTLSSATNLVAGDYTIAVTGGEFVEGSNTGAVTVEAQKIGNIEFNSTTLAKTGAAGVATVGFKVFDQYGTDVTGSAQSLVNAIEWTANVAVDSLNDANGVLTIDLAGGADFAANQKILITAVDPATGVNKAVTFDIGEVAAVNSLTLGEVKFPTDKTRVYTGSDSAATLEIVAEDQYGNKLDTAAKLSGITVLSSDAGVVPSVVDVDNKPVIKLDTTALTTAKSVNLTVVINATGQTITKAVDVVKPSEPDVVTLGNLETNVIAQGDAAGKLVLPVTVVNQFGETMTAKQVADAYAAGKLTVTATGSLSAATLTVDTDSTSKNYGKVVNTAAVSDAAGVGTIVVTTATGKTASTNVTTQAARKVVELAAPKTIITNLVSGANTSYKFDYKDQYGDSITPVAANTNADLTWEVEVTDLTGDAGVITANTSADALTGAAEEALGTVTVSSVAGKTGTAKVTAKLVNASGEVVSQVENTFKVVANNTEGLTYQLDDIPTLKGAVAGAVDGSDAYARPIVVTAVDAQGAKYAIPASMIIGVTSSDTAVATVSATALGDVAIDAQDNQWVVAGADITGGTDASKTASISVQINTESGVQIVTKDVTVSKAAAKAQELSFVSAAPTAGNPYELPTGTTDVTAITFSNLTELTTGKTAFLVTEDQYGVIGTVASDLVVNTPQHVSLGAEDKFEVLATGTLKLTDNPPVGATVVAGKDIVLSAVKGNLTDTVTIKVTE